MNRLTIISGIFDIGRREDNLTRRSARPYYVQHSQWLRELPIHKVIYIDPEVVAAEWGHDIPDYVRSVSLEELPCYDLLNRFTEFRRKHPLCNSDALKDTPLYCVFQRAKIDLIRRTILAEHESTYFAWIDAGISGSVPIVGIERALSDMGDRVNVIHVGLSMNATLPAYTDIRHDFAMGYIAGSADKMLALCDAFEAEDQRAIDAGFAAHDETILTRAFLLQPDLFHVHNVRYFNTMFEDYTMADAGLKASQPDRKCDLVQLFAKYGTDKLANRYTPLYHAILHHRREQIQSLLEVGIGTMIPGVHSSMVGYAREGYAPGGSLRAWRDYLPNAMIIGIDVQPDTQVNEDRIRTLLCDSTNESQVSNVIGERLFDVIIDDGSHINENQLRTLRNLYPRLNPGGLYVIEDVHPGNSLTMSPHLAQIVGHNGFFFAGREASLCIICAPVPGRFMFPTVDAQY